MVINNNIIISDFKEVYMLGPFWVSSRTPLNPNDKGRRKYIQGLYTINRLG
jgi:hypothetical protein